MKVINKRIHFLEELENFLEQYESKKISAVAAQPALQKLIEQLSVCDY